MIEPGWKRSKTTFNRKSIDNKRKEKNCEQINLRKKKHLVETKCAQVRSSRLLLC